MDEVDRQLIQTNYINLSEAIAPDIKLLTKDLYQRRLISQAMSDSVIEKNTTDMDRAMALLDLVPRRGGQAMETLYTSCLSRQLWEAADILRPSGQPHGPSVLPPAPQGKGGTGEGRGDSLEEMSSDEEPLPNVWPHDDKPDLMRLKVFKVEDFEEKKKKKYKQRYKNAHTTQGLDHHYSMTKSKRGLVYIINNKKFTSLSDRDGTEKDELGFKMLCQKLGCQVKVLRDLTAKGIWEKCVGMSEEDFTQCDCFILCILTHGHNGVVFGTDGKEDEGTKKIENYVKIQKITDLFGKVKSLTGKPKLFFIQACQGTGRDSGKPVVLPEQDDGTPPPKPRTPGPEAGDKGSDVSLGYLNQERTDSHGEKLPSRADVFVAMATTPDTVSWRRPDFGTWFIQAVIEVFARYAYKFELMQLMRRVNSLLVKAETVKGYKQVMEKRDTFMKQFYFFPGLSRTDLD